MFIFFALENFTDFSFKKNFFNQDFEKNSKSSKFGKKYLAGNFGNQNLEISRDEPWCPGTNQLLEFAAM